VKALPSSLHQLPGRLIHGPAYAETPDATALGWTISPATLDVVREADASMSDQGWEYAPPAQVPAEPTAEPSADASN